MIPLESPTDGCWTQFKTMLFLRANQTFPFMCRLNEQSSTLFTSDETFRAILFLTVVQKSKSCLQYNLCLETKIFLFFPAEISEQTGHVCIRCSLSSLISFSQLQRPLCS